MKNLDFTKKITSLSIMLLMIYGCTSSTYNNNSGSSIRNTQLAPVTSSYLDAEMKLYIRKIISGFGDYFVSLDCTAESENEKQLRINDFKAQEKKWLQALEKSMTRPAAFRAFRQELSIHEQTKICNLNNVPMAESMLTAQKDISIRPNGDQLFNWEGHRITVTFKCGGDKECYQLRDEVYNFINTTLKSQSGRWSIKKYSSDLYHFSQNYNSPYKYSGGFSKGDNVENNHWVYIKRPSVTDCWEGCTDEQMNTITIIFAISEAIKP